MADPHTLLFVHGTGVRELRFRHLFDQVAAAVDRLGLADRTLPCFWGSEYGARLEVGASIPTYDDTSYSQDPLAESRRHHEARWALLEIDPLFELRVLTLEDTQPPVQSDAQVGRSTLRQDVKALAGSEEVSRFVSDAGSAEVWLDCLDSLLFSPEFDVCVAKARGEAIRERRAIAVTLVALAEQAKFSLAENPASVDARDALVDAIVRELDADVAGIISDLGTGLAQWAFGTTALAVLPSASWMAARRRGAIADATTPCAGDILLYQSKGAGIRRYIRAAIESVDGDVTVVGHSLGGIASVDLLATTEMPNVKALITVGSQAPFLYEIGALWSLSPDMPLPDSFPRWLNIYDRKDFLSFIAEPLFGPQVHDLEVDNRASFPRSHSEYWANTQMWTSIQDWL